MVAATICSGAIGFDRERKSRPAGLRTHIIVCAASTLIMFVGIQLKNEYLATSPNVDPARLAAQILSGIGFLGAGTIIKGRDYVYGPTTAATLWSVACIGITIGAGFVLEAGCATFALFFILKVVSRLEYKLLNARRSFVLQIGLEGPLKNMDELELILASNHYRLVSHKILSGGPDKVSGENLYQINVSIRSLSGKVEEEPTADSLIEHFAFVKSVKTL